MDYFEYLGIKIYLSRGKIHGWPFHFVNEFWKRPFGIDKMYLISTQGRIRSLHKGKPKFVKHHLSKKLYQMVYLSEFGKKRITNSRHRLVALTFIPNPENKPQVNHKNGNKNDNRMLNVEWNTCVENITHAIESGLRPADINLRSNNMFTESDIRDIRKMIKENADNRLIAQKYHCHHSTICKIRRGVHYPGTGGNPETIWDDLNRKNKILLDMDTGVFFENLKIAAHAKNIKHQTLRYTILKGKIKSTSVKYV